MTRTATEKQVNFVKTLLKDKNLEGTQFASPVWVNGITDPKTGDVHHLVDNLGKVEASRVIKELLTLPRSPKAITAKEEREPIEDGIYMLGGDIFKVQHAVHGSGNQYAKRLEMTDSGVFDGERAYPAKFTFNYVRGAVNRLRPEHKMTLEQAKEFGALYGTCCVCGRTLTDEVSIAEGIGPVCGKRFAA